MEGQEDIESQISNRSISHEEFKRREDLGVNVFLRGLEKRLSLKQKLQKWGIKKEINRLVHDPNTENIEDYIIDYACKFSENKMQFLILAIFSKEFVNASWKDQALRKRDLMAGKMLDNLTQKLQEKRSSESLTETE